MANRERSVGFFQSCVEARSPPEPEDLPVGSHPDSPIISYMRKHGVPINMSHSMKYKEPESAIAYGTHSSENKEQSFVRTELAEQQQAVHVAIFPLAAIYHLKKLWLSLLAAIPQTGHKPRLI